MSNKRPELKAPPEVFYNEEEARKYTSNTRMIEIQNQMTLRALELLGLQEDEPCFLLDIGCGSGLSGEVLTEQGHYWVGFDISKSMLDIAKEREVEGDLVELDAGMGVPFRPGTFDGCISISALQWLCNADKKWHNPVKRLHSFFTTLYTSLKRGGKAIFQFYPDGPSQVELITSQAIRSGFSGGVVVDYPNSTRAKKMFLVLFAGVTNAVLPQALGTEGAENTIAFTDNRERNRNRNYKGKPAKKSKEWIQKKKERKRRQGKDVRADSKYSVYNKTKKKIKNEYVVTQSTMDVNTENILGSPDEKEIVDGLQFPVEVEEALKEVISGTDPLDGKDFNPVDYINALFPSEQSLANIDEVVARIRMRIRKLDNDIRGSIRAQTDSESNGKQALEAAKEDIHEVFSKIKDIKEKADKSEDMVKEITRDIKQLDHGKKHLTSSITTLNHLHMLVGGVDSLQVLSKNRKYGEVSNLLQGVLNVLDHFKKYMAIPQIKQLADKVNIIQANMALQVVADFKNSLSDPDVKPTTGANSLICNACKVINVLEPKVKEDVLLWLMNKQLSDYLNVFNENFDVAWIDKIDRRYAWLKRILIQFEEEFQHTFPTEWSVEERICVHFCSITKQELTRIMSDRRGEIDVKLLLFAIQRTTAFENFLDKRFAYGQMKNDKGPTPESHFQGHVSKCFEDHLHIYIEAQDKNLSELIEKFIADLKMQGVPKLGDDTEGTVLPSAGEMFVFYKKCMVQCIQLSTGNALLLLTVTFKKYLTEYANKLLLGNLPKVSSSGGLANILKDKDNEVKFSDDEKRLICCILTTSEYCQETTQQLQDKLKEKVDTNLADKIDLNTEQDLFHQVISNSIQLLVQDLENACEPALTAMIKVHWQSIESVGDQSGYVTAIISHLRQSLPVIRDNLFSSRKYFTQFCIKFVNSFIPRFINNIYKCKPLSAIGAEQLLLDAHSIKTALLDLPAIGSTVQRKPPASFTKVVIKGMSKAEMILKVVMSPHTSQTGFVESYIKLLNDTDTANFQKLLDMKGLKRSEQHSMLEIFRSQMVSTNTPNTASATSKDSSNVSESSRIRRLEKLIKKQF